MDEPRVSICIRFSVKGYDSQLTVRNDDAKLLQGDFEGAIAFLERNHCLPERRWEAAKNGNGHGNGNGTAKATATPAPKPAAGHAAPAGSKPVCAKCGTAEAMELIAFNDRKTGEPRKAFKCQTCLTWVR